MKDIKAVFTFCYQFTKHHKRIFIISTLSGFAFFSMGIITPYLLGSFIDNLLLNPVASTIYTYCLFYLLTELGQFLFAVITKLNGAKLFMDMLKDMFLAISKSLHSTSLSNTFHMTASGTAQKINGDCQRIIYFYTNVCKELPAKIINFVIPLIFLFRVDWVLGIAVICLMPVLYLLYTKSKSRLYKTRVDFENADTDTFSKLCEQLSDFKLIKLNNLTDVLARRLVSSITETRKKYSKQVLTSFVYSLVQSNADILLKAFLFIYGGISILNGRMTIGNFVTISSYFSVISIAFYYFLSIGENIQNNRVYLDRLTELLGKKEETNGCVQLDDIDKIELKDLNFSYGSNKIIHAFNYSFEKGKIYTIVGNNGSGKSTLISLLLGLYIDEINGDIFYAGNPIKNINMKSFRERSVAVSEQEPILLNDTIRYNITYDNLNHEIDGQILDYFSMLGLKEYIDSVPYGLDAIISDDLTNISGGQKQKISLVRSILKNPKLLVLDEPTSALDNDSKQTFINYLVSSKKDRITIVITHDTAFQNAADCVINLP